MLDGKLNEYLHKIDKVCYERIEQFVEQMKAGRQLQKLLRILIAKMWSYMEWHDILFMWLGMTNRDFDRGV